VAALPKGLSDGKHGEDIAGAAHCEKDALEVDATMVAQHWCEWPELTAMRPSATAMPDRAHAQTLFGDRTLAEAFRKAKGLGTTGLLVLCLAEFARARG
jgi:hypothetical protein